MQLLGEMPKDTLYGVGVCVRAQLQQLVSMKPLLFTGNPLLIANTVY
jgi:hypothetical protein